MNRHRIRRTLVCLFGFLLFGAVAAGAQSPAWVYQAVSISIGDNPDPGELTGFGSAVAIEGRTALVGIPFYSPNAFPGSGPGGQGRVAVFTADAATGTVWTRTGSIENPDSTITKSFGQTLAVQHGRLIVGSTSAIFAFEKRGAGADEEWKLLATITGAGFGSAVALRKDILVVRAPYEDMEEDSNYNFPAQGAGYVYLRKGKDCGEGTWTLSQRIRPDPNVSGTYGELGYTVAVDGEHAAFGAPLSTQTLEPAPGVTLIYQRQGDELVFEGPAPSVSDGTSMAMSEKRLIIGTDADYEPFGLYEQATIVDFDPPAATAGSGTSP